MADSSYQGKSNRPSESARRQTPEQGAPINPRRKFRRRGTGDSEIKYDSDTDNEMQSTSESEELELDEVGSDVEYDEEAGLTSEERRKHMQQKRRLNKLDARIAGESNLSQEEKRAADKDVIRKLIVNALLILSWYFFSLSISIVRIIYTIWHPSADIDSTTNGCSQAITSTSTTLSSPPLSTCWFNSSLHRLSSWYFLHFDQNHHHQVLMSHSLAPRQQSPSSLRYSISLVWCLAEQRLLSILALETLHSATSR